MPKSYFHWLSDFLSHRYFYTSAFFLCHQSCFSCFWSQFPLFLDVSKLPSSIPILHRHKPPMPEKVVRPTEALFSVSSGLEIVSKLCEIFYSGCAVSSLIVRLGGTLDRLCCCRGWGDANQHLLLDISNYTICSKEINKELSTTSYADMIWT